MEHLIGLVAVAAPFITAIAIVWGVHRGPKAQAKAEIMKAHAQAEIDARRLQITGANDERMALTLVEQEKRIDSLEEEVAFLRKIIENR